MLARLGPKLLERHPQIDRWRRYYEGDQALPQGPSEHWQALKNFQKTARTQPVPAVRGVNGAPDQGHPGLTGS
jgi:hypothetical protein